MQALVAPSASPAMDAIALRELITAEAKPEMRAFRTSAGSPRSWVPATRAHLQITKSTAIGVGPGSMTRAALPTFPLNKIIPDTLR